MQFVSSQPTRRSIHSKCCFMEVIDKTGCSPGKGRWSVCVPARPSWGSREASEPKEKCLKSSQDLAIFVTRDKISRNSSSPGREQIRGRFGGRLGSGFSQATLLHPAGSAQPSHCWVQPNTALLQRSEGSPEKITYIYRYLTDNGNTDSCNDFKPI